MKIPKIGKEGKGEIVELPALEPVAPETSPGEIDARRAKHVLERAVLLTEKGDYPGAILAARQAIALDHDFGEAYSVLGGLLDRTGDIKGAVAAHEKAVELLPTNTLERTTLERLREKLGERSAGSAAGGFFNFDDGELFDPTAELPPVIEAKLPPTRAELEARAESEASFVVESAQDQLAQSEAIENDMAPAQILHHSATSESEFTDKSPGEDASKGPMENTSATLDSPPVPVTPIVLPEIKITAPPAPVVSLTPPTAVQRRARDERRQISLPVDHERRSGRDRRADAAALAARAQNATTPFVFNPLTDTPKPPIWAQVLRGPSFFARTLPLVAVTIFSLGFLSWARGRAVTQSAPIVSLNEPSDPPVNSAGNPVTVPQTAPPVQSVPAPGPNLAPPPGAQSGFDINNRPLPLPTSAPRAVAPASGPRVVRNSTNVRPVIRSGAPSRPTSNFPGQQLPPAAIPPQGVNTQNNAEENPSGGALRLPQPQIQQPAPADPPTRVLPPSSAAPPVVPGGGALNPAGNPARGYVRIQSGRNVLTAPPRAQNQANNAEQEAAAAVRGGQPDRAIQNLTAAINANASDAGFRLQQRASLFLERGDYTRAADDFQAAINAYQDQITRGEDVNSARAGLRSARSGLNRALARRGG